MKNQETKLKLRALAHHLKPIVIIGDKGLTDAVQKEIEAALLAHELIKIRVNAADKTAREKIIAVICQEKKAELIQSIGHTVTIYRQKPEKVKKK